MTKTTEINSCEVCGNHALEPVLNLGKQPLCDDLVPLGDPRICQEYPIEILFCKQCYTGHQRYQVPKRELFPNSYHYRSRFTQDVLNGMSSLVDACETRLTSLTNKTVLDIGCNDGSLLSFFQKKGCTTIGIEPTSAYSDAEECGHIVYNDFLSPELAKDIVKNHGCPDIITFTNVFAHIENLSDVLSALKALMSPSTVIVIENHYLGSVLKDNQFDTFYHEHPRTYSYTSFAYIAKSLGVSLVDVEFPARYGGNIRVFLADSAQVKLNKLPDLSAVQKQETHFYQAFVELQNKVHLWQKAKKKFIDDHVKQYGKIQAKAFPGRCAILIKLLNLTDEHISAVYEKPGSLKIGNYVPGTRIPIISDEALFDLPNKTKPLLNLAWHISKEIKNYMTQQGFTGSIIDILEPEDFVIECTSPV